MTCSEAFLLSSASKSTVADLCCTISISISILWASHANCALPHWVAMRRTCMQTKQQVGSLNLHSAVASRLSPHNFKAPPVTLSIPSSASERTGEPSTSTSTSDGFAGKGIDYKRVAATATSAALIYTLVAGVRPVQAKEHVWKPRRHHRHIGERFGDDWAMDVVMVSRIESRSALPHESTRLMSYSNFHLFQSHGMFLNMCSNMHTHFAKMQNDTDDLDHVDPCLPFPDQPKCKQTSCTGAACMLIS